MAVLNRLLVVLLGLVLAAAGALLVAETVTAAISQPPLVVDRSLVDARLAELSWLDPEVDITLAILIGLGALLLLPQLIPRQPDTLRLRAGQGRQAEIDRKALAALLAARANADHEVLAARANVKRRAANVDVRATPGAEVRRLRERLGRMVSDTLEPLELSKPLRNKVNVRRSRERSS